MYTFREFFIPDYMASSIDDYLKEGILPGKFLTAIICNNLLEAVMYADDTNISNIPAFVSFFHNEAPSVCWGSEEKMNAWISAKAKVRETIKRNREKREDA